MLEVKIDELIVAVRELTLAMSLSVIAANPKKPIKEPIDLDRAAGLGDFTHLIPDEVPNEQPQTTTDTSPSSEPESKAVTYDDVKKLIIAITKQSKDKAVAALSRLGVANGKELKPEQWAEAAEYLAKVANGEMDPGDAS